MLFRRSSTLLTRVSQQTYSSIGVRSRRLLSTATNEPQRKDSPVTWSLLGLAVGIGGLAVGYYLREKDAARQRIIQSGTKSIGKPLLGGPFTLVNHKGEVVTDKSLFQEGNKSFGLLYFGFTHCPDICPSEMVKMTKVINKLDDMGGVFKDRMLPIFISVDPRRDGVAQLEHYVKDFHPRTIGLTGTPQQIASICKAYRVYHVQQQTQNQDEDYLVDHSIVIYLLAPNGEFLDFFTQLSEPDEIIERIKNRVIEYDKDHSIAA